jgi:NAD-dependent DNA ligase
MTCDCIARANTQLAARNTRITVPIIVHHPDEVRPMIVTEQIETGRGKQKAIGMFASFCPWCGEKIVRETEEGTSHG